jgi:hypothetical protein
MDNHNEHQGDTGESPKERGDRELLELLNGLRVIIPGVQVLFAFLLAVPFAAGFAEAEPFQRNTLFVTTIAAVVSTVLLIAPAAQYRVLFQAGAKEKLLHRANRFALAGTLILGVAMVAALLLILDFLFARSLAIVACVAVAALLLWAWQIQPAITRARSSKG